MAFFFRTSRARGLTKLRMVVIGFLAVGVFLYAMSQGGDCGSEAKTILSEFRIKTEQRDQRHELRFKSDYLAPDTKDSGVDVTCQFPTVDPFDPQMMKLSKLDQEPLNCVSKLPDLTYLQGNNLRINFTLVKQTVGRKTLKQCKYHHILRDPGHDGSYKESAWIYFHHAVTLPYNTEYIRVVCEGEKENILSKTYYALIPPKKDLEDLEATRLKKRQVEFAPSETLNVIMVGIDTLTRHHMLRSMNKTYSYLTETLGAFDFTMHSQAGERTFPNLLPLFTGHSEFETSQWWNSSQYSDAYELVWNVYNTAGYRTLYTEDWPSIAAFHYLKKGFRYQVADYSTRPLTVAMEEDQDLWKPNWLCAGNRAELEFHLDYGAKFIDAFPTKPKFVQIYNGKICHENQENAKMADEILYSFFKGLQERGHLHNSMLVFFSDHGLRWGPIRESDHGFVESRSPFTLLRLPEWFLNKYDDVAEHLRRNTRRLTSHYDTHATLLDLLYFQSPQQWPLLSIKHGISLFRNIPRDRICDDVPIPPTFCLCGLKNMEQEDVDTQLSQKMGALLVDKVNDLRDPTICTELKLNRIMLVIKFTIDARVTREKKSKTLYRIRLETKPGGAIYETSFFYTDNTDNFEISDYVERLNLYRGTSECQMNTRLRPFCYCKSLLSGGEVNPDLDSLHMK